MSLFSSNHYSKAATMLSIAALMSSTGMALANTTTPAQPKVIQIQAEEKPVMSYGFSVEDQAKIKTVEKAATSTRGSAFDKKNLDINTLPSSSNKSSPAVVATAATGTAIAGATATVPTNTGGIFKEIPPNAASGATATTPTSSPSVETSQPAGQPPLFKTLQDANAAGINPMASAPKIGAPASSATAASPSDATPDLSNPDTLMNRVAKNWMKLSFGLLLIGVGAWLYLRKD